MKKKELIYLLSFIFSDDKFVKIDPLLGPEKREKFERYGLTGITAGNASSQERWKGVLRGNEAWLTDHGRLVVLNDHDLFYIQINENNRFEYVEGLQMKELFGDADAVFAVINDNDKILWLAPLCRSLWELWRFKHILKTMRLSEFIIEQQTSLAEFLWRNNSQKNRWF